MNGTSYRRVAPAFAALALGITLSACGAADNGSGDTKVPDSVKDASGKVAVDGSSTVYPMSNTVAELLAGENSDIKTTVGFAGTGGGFEKFCAGKTDINDASRPIKDDEEAPVCADAGIDYTELLVATDALTVVVNKDLAVDCLKTEQLVELFQPGSKINNWQQLGEDFPDQEISFFFPGTDSGTYDYMAADVVEHDSETLRSDSAVESSEDDNVLVAGVKGSQGGVGFFGYSYFEENAKELKAVSIDNGEGCVAPSAETAQDGSYAPLARPLFIYVNNKSYADKPAVTAFVDYYVENLATVAETAQFIPLNEDDYAATKEALAGIS